MNVFDGHIVFLHSGERDHVAALLTLKAKWVATLTKTMEIMMNNAVLIIFPDRLKDTERAGRVGSRAIDSS